MMGLMEQQYGDLLEGLNREIAPRPPEDLNEVYIVDLAARYFNRVQLDRIQSEMDDALRRNDGDEAEDAWSSYKKIQLGSGNGAGFKVNAESIARALLNREHNQMVIWPKDLGRFISPHFSRDCFISFVGPEKRGKSYW